MCLHIPVIDHNYAAEPSYLVTLSREKIHCLNALAKHCSRARTSFDIRRTHQECSLKYLEESLSEFGQLQKWLLAHATSPFR